MSDHVSIEPSIHATPDACISDFTPPTFAGIVTLTSNLNGSLSASWSAASDPSTPISYEIYILEGVQSASSVFQAANKVLTTQLLAATLYYDATLTNLKEVTDYTVGVRARDAVGNTDFNLVVLTAQSSGVLNENLNGVAQLLKIALKGIRTSVDAEVSVTGQLDGDLSATELEATVEENPDVNC
jgi:hypothetical protein